MRIILCFLLSLVAAPAWAEWVKVSVAEDGSLSIYIDPASIRKDGNLRKVWQINARKQRDKDGAMSVRARHEYDCKEDRFRVLAASSHSEPMAGGDVLESADDPSTWFAIPPDTLSARVLKVVCAPVSTPDLAKWVKVDEAEDGSIAFYIDPDSIRKNGNLRKVRQIQNLKQRDKDGFMSRRMLKEYDCKEERSRTLSLSTHSDPMAGGVTLWSKDYSDNEWSAIPPNTVGETLLKIICAK